MCLNSVKEERVLIRKTTVYGVYCSTYIHRTPKAHLTALQECVITVGLNTVRGEENIYMIPRVYGGQHYRAGFHRFPNLKSARLFKEDYTWPSAVIMKDYIPKGTKITVGTQRVGLEDGNVFPAPETFPTVYVSPVIEHTNEVM